MTENNQMPETGTLYSGASPAQVAADIAELVNFQPEGMPHSELQALISKNLEPHLMRYDLPQFQSMFNAFPPPEAKMGAQVALQYNQGVTNWQVSPGGAVLEELCCQALCELFYLGPDADATFMYSGTYGNQQALYMALHRHAEVQGFDFSKKGIAGFKDPSRLAVLVSQDAHFSLKHSVRLLGLGEECLVTLPLNVNRQIDKKNLQQITGDLSARRDVFCMVATAGTTSTGAIDPVDAMAEICGANGIWLHVDGAYGYAYKLVPEWSSKFNGSERADSILWDPHKQLGAPIPNSILFVKEKFEFARMALHSSYFNRQGDTEPNPGLKSPPSTRPMSALPLVAILRGQGTEKVIENLRSPLLAIAELAKTLKKQPDVQVLHQPDLGILCFRLAPAGTPTHKLDALQRSLYQRVMATGQRTISMTKIDGNTALRLVVVSPHTKFEDLQETIRGLRELV